MAAPSIFLPQDDRHRIPLINIRSRVIGRLHRQQLNNYCNFCKGVFQLWTDHKPLFTALCRVSVPISPQQQCHLAFISEFNVQLLYLPGLKNVVADFLSYPLLESTETVAAMAAADPMDFKEMATKQSSCAETQRLLGGTSLKLAQRQCFYWRFHRRFRPIVPLKFRKDIFAHFYNVTYPGRLASRRIISSWFVWCGLSSEIIAWTRGCLAWQRGRIHCHIRLAPQPIPIPQR